MLNPPRMSPKAPKIHVTHPNVPLGSHENLIDEKEKEKHGVENPVFTFDTVSLLSRSSSPTKPEDEFSEPVRVLPPLRRGSYSPFLPINDTNSLAVPDGKGVRRSSLASTWSRDSTLSHRRLKPISSLSISDMVCEAKVQPLPSPGLLSTHSMWSTSDLFSRPSSRLQQDPDSVSNLTNSNSLSNVSSTLSERMHELVRAFSSRTQRTKEKTTQPPSPSSISSHDAKSIFSAVSALDEEDKNPAPRNIRLGSFIPMGSQTSEAFSEASEVNKEMLVGVWQCRFRMPKCFRKIRFPNTIDPQSKLYVSWLFIVMLAFMYNAIVIPLRGFFPYQTPQNLWVWLICDYTCDFLYILDIILFKARVRFVNNGIIECDRTLTKKHYMKKLMFKLDIFSLLPLDLIYLAPSVGVTPWLRIPRLFKMQTFWEFYERCDQAANSSAHAIRIIKTMTYMLFLIHIETCGYYAVSVFEGINSNKWVYSGEGNAYIRCFYLATKTATSIGNNPKPTNQLEYLFMTLYWVSGVFVFALLIGQIRDIVEAAGLVKSNYRKKMDATMRYMESINIPKDMQERVRMWFLYNWEQQKTTDEGQLLEGLPRKLQTDLAINVHFNTLSKVQLFQDCDKNLLYDLVLKIKPSLFLPQDYICYKGEVGKEMYIVNQGRVEVVGGEDGETVLATLHEGSVFGEISLLAMSGGNRRTANVRSKGYTYVFTLSKADFEEAMREYPEAQKLLRKRAKKLLKENARLEKKSQKVEPEEIIKKPTETPKFVKTVIKVMDPESNVVKHLESSIKQGSSMRSLHTVDSSSSSSSKTSLSKEELSVEKLPNKTPTAFVFGSEVSLSDIPDDARVGYDLDDEEDELLIIEKIEQIMSEDSQINMPVIQDKQMTIVKDEFDKTNNSVESQDSGIPSMKRSTSQSTDKSLSNQDSKDSFNTADLMDVINEEIQKADDGGSSVDPPPIEKRESPSGASFSSDHCDAEIRVITPPQDFRDKIPDEVPKSKPESEDNPIIDGTRRKISASSQDSYTMKDGTRRKVSTESKEEGRRRKSSKDSREIDPLQRKISGESIKSKSRRDDGNRRKGSSESKQGDGERRKISNSSRESEGARRKVSSDSPKGRSIEDSSPEEIIDSVAENGRQLQLMSDRREATLVETSGSQLQRKPSPPVHAEMAGNMLQDIPLENKVTCAVEIHREKSRTPSSIFSLEHQERLASNVFYRQNSNVSYETEL